MANPKKRRTSAAVGRNRAHLALEKTSLDKCPQCGHAKEPHKACAFCGTYKGKEVAAKKKTVKK